MPSFNEYNAIVCFDQRCDKKLSHERSCDASLRVRESHVVFFLSDWLYHILLMKLPSLSLSLFLWPYISQWSISFLSTYSRELKRNSLQKTRRRPLPSASSLSFHLFLSSLPCMSLLLKPPSLILLKPPSQVHSISASLFNTQLRSVKDLLTTCCDHGGLGSALTTSSLQMTGVKRSLEKQLLKSRGFFPAEHSCQNQAKCPNRNEIFASLSFLSSSLLPLICGIQEKDGSLVIFAKENGIWKPSWCSSHSGDGRQACSSSFCVSERPCHLTESISSLVFRRETTFREWQRRVLRTFASVKEKSL